jgi:hypothetical protein
MARKGAPGIIAVGNRHEWPREFWGSRDWEDEDQLQAQLNSSDLGSGVVPPPLPQPISYFPKSRRRATASVRSDAVDKLIEKYVGRR